MHMEKTHNGYIKAPPQVQSRKSKSGETSLESWPPRAQVPRSTSIIRHTAGASRQAAGRVEFGYYLMKPSRQCLPWSVSDAPSTVHPAQGAAMALHRKP